MRRGKLKGKKYWQVKLQEKADIEGWLFVQGTQTVEDSETIKVEESAVVVEPPEKAARL